MRKKITALGTAALMLLSGLWGTVPHAAAEGIAATEDSDDLLLDCGSRAGYDYLGTMENGKARQKVYNNMLKAATELWNDSERDLNDKCRGHLYYAIIKNEGLSFYDMVKVYFTFKNDFPLFYFADNMMLGTDFEFYMVTDESYRYGSDRAELQKGIQEYIAATAAKADGKASAYETAMAIHDTLNAELEYAFDDNDSYSKEAWAHNIIGASKMGKGVCETYSRTYQALLNYLDIDNMVVLGSAQGGDHAWNIVKLDDGKYYYVDCTWDDMLRDHTYFAKGEETMSADHTPDVPCDDAMHFLIELPKANNDDFDPEYLKQDHPAPQPENGDVNADGNINVTDISLIAAHLKSIKALSDEALTRADLNGDGIVSVTDVSRLAAKVKGTA